MEKHVAVVGLGYVGLPLALLAKSKGFEVIGLDKDKQKRDLINVGKTPIKDPVLAREILEHPIEATDDVARINQADIVIVCVPTPVKNHTEPDLTPLKKACIDVAQNLKKGALIIIESTVNPGVCDEIVIPLVEEVSGMKIGRDFYLAHCPERISPGDPNFSVRNINRVVGAQNKKGLVLAVKFYKSIIDAEIKPMATLKETEAVKIVENSFRDVNIAFVNELAMSFHKLGINVENVIDGAATKPFAFMAHRPGSGVGGHCIPVDPYYLIEYARGHGFEHDFLALARKINNGMPAFTVQLVEEVLKQLGKSIKDTRVTLLGLAYKPNVGDDRESPAYEIRDLLIEKGADLVTYDPFISTSSVNSLNEALEGSSVVVIATAHDEFREITPKLLKQAGIDAVVDGRNILKEKVHNFQKQNIRYTGVGINL